MKYCPEIVNKICDALREGKTQTDAANLAGINKDTYYEWLRTKPDFSDAVKAAQADFQEWENKELLKEAKKGLKRLIMGEEYDEVTTEYEQDPKNPSAPRIKRQTRKTKRIPPNATAIIFALTNRDPENWKNRIQQDLAGKVQIDEQPNISLANVPDDLLEKVIESLKTK